MQNPFLLKGLYAFSDLQRCTMISSNLFLYVVFIFSSLGTMVYHSYFQFKKLCDIDFYEILLDFADSITLSLIKGYFVSC